VFSGFSYLPGHMPSARTSVGNKEYEYEGKKERAASLQQAGNRHETVSFGGAAVAVALRHVTDRKTVCDGLSTKNLMTKTSNGPKCDLDGYPSK
jgi:D-serine deaminase-like pyridoxal phosphate-dependent protein